MNYAFYVDLGDMKYEDWYSMYSTPENAKKREGWWGPEHVGKSGDNSAVILAQVNDEKRLSAHMKMVREMASKLGMHHSFYKLTEDGR